ncbi:adenosine deaminase [uncultured Albimonas sp.]|uniref:adenosine deaminase n=1 Tax=uncultured Albimonas sp. TaxID=1331701 RepID=UPI0030EE0D48
MTAKIELHLHIEGAAPPALARELAARKGVDTSGMFAEGGGYAWTDFTDFLRAYDRVAALFATPEDHRQLAEAVLRECAAHGVIYAELAISSDHVAEGDSVRFAEYLAAITEGAEAARAATGIEANFIATTIRHLGPDRAVHAARLAVACDHPRVVGLGLAGDERVFHPADFAPAFEIAREGGLKLTAHAGEACGADSVRAAMDALKLDRVDHGVRAIEDPALLARILDERIHLATCPGSNVALGSFPDWRSHPIAPFRALGVSASVSTDDPPFFATDMDREYVELTAAFGWGEAEFAAIARDALDGAFCDAGTKAALAAKL